MAAYEVTARNGVDYEGPKLFKAKTAAIRFARDLSAKSRARVLWVRRPTGELVAQFQFGKEFTGNPQPAY